MGEYVRLRRMKKAFSLVELSIVLVILGLLVGGVLSGQSLIRAAELRAVSTEYARYSTAVSSFRDKYFALPGDMANATLFWTAQDAGDGLGTDCTNAASTGTATCNGNGDGQVTANYERFRYWQHLANAGLIEGNYSGVGTPVGGLISTIGTNVPRSKLNNSGWTSAFLGVILPADTGWFEGSYGNTLFNGTQQAGADTANPNLKPEEMWNIDTKIDDGRPGLGAMRAAESSTNCHTSTSPSTSQYNLSNSGVLCNSYFLNVGG